MCSGCSPRKPNADVSASDEALHGSDKLPLRQDVGCRMSDADDECVYNERLFGVYHSEDDGSTLKIAQAEDGKYAISINLFRLTDIDDCIGELKDGKLVFTGTDASENPISGEITVEGDSARLVFTDSTWEYLPDGTTCLFKRK